MYDDPVLDQLLSYVRRHDLMRPGDRVGVAVSGGADSVALLRSLREAREALGIVLSVVHFNHKIRGADADADEAFVRDLARGLDLQFNCESDDTPAYSGEHRLSLEAAGRALRYAFFHRLIAEGAADRIATAHTRDDQAETVLMRFLRGAGTRGLAGVHPGIAGWACTETGSEPALVPPGPRIIRPLLEITRADLRVYLERMGQSWREDASNLDVAFPRNRLRHEIIPLLRQLNPNLDRVLSETAEIAREEEEYWTRQVSSLLPGILSQSAIENRQSSIALPSLLQQPLALRRRLLRAAAERHGLHLDFHQVDQVLGLAASPPEKSEKALELPRGWQAVRQDRELWFRRGGQAQAAEQQYDCPLAVPGQVEVAGRTIRAALVSGGEVSPPPETAANRVVVDPETARSGLAVRNWRPGDRYQPAHTGAPKKLKELLQAPHIPRAQKPSWPVVVSGDHIVWVPGFATPEQFQLRNPHGPALLLEQLPLRLSAGKAP